MNSSGMPTARLLTVSQHALGRGCVYPSMHWAGGCVYPSMHWAGGCIPACTGQWGGLLSGCLPRGCVYLGGGVGVSAGGCPDTPLDQRQTPPLPWTDRHL